MSSSLADKYTYIEKSKYKNRHGEEQEYQWAACLPIANNKFPHLANYGLPAGLSTGPLKKGSKKDYFAEDNPSVFLVPSVLFDILVSNMNSKEKAKEKG